MKIKSILILVSLSLCSGCGTIGEHIFPTSTNPVYSGTRNDCHIIGEKDTSAIAAVGLCVDLPFSFVADTLLLPSDLYEWSEIRPREPLKGWTFKPFPGWGPPPYGHNTNHLDQSIVDDYEGFIKQKGLMLDGALTGFYEDGTGQHAVQFSAFPPDENATWQYVLVYNKENKRIKTIRFNYQRYMS